MVLPPIHGLKYYASRLPAHVDSVPTQYSTNVFYHSIPSNNLLHYNISSQNPSQSYGSDSRVGKTTSKYSPARECCLQGRGPTLHNTIYNKGLRYFSLFFSSRQMHSAAINAISTPGAICTAYVCCPNKMSLPLRILRLMRATMIPPCASSIISAVVSNQFPRIVSVSWRPFCEVNVAVALLPSNLKLFFTIMMRSPLGPSTVNVAWICRCSFTMLKIWTPAMSVTFLRPEMDSSLPSTWRMGVPLAVLMLKESPVSDSTFSLSTMVSGPLGMN